MKCCECEVLEKKVKEICKENSAAAAPPKKKRANIVIPFAGTCAPQMFIAPCDMRLKSFIALVILHNNTALPQDAKAFVKITADGTEIFVECEIKSGETEFAMNKNCNNKIKKGAKISVACGILAVDGEMQKLKTSYVGSLLFN